MSYVDDLLHAYSTFVALPWQRNLAAPQRVWMAVYPPEHERRLRLRLPDFGTATNQHGHPWTHVDISASFETWMAAHPYRDAYFDEPDLLETALPAFFDHLVDDVRTRLAAHPDPNGVVGLIGAGTLFGLGPEVKVSALVHAVGEKVAGRLLVFFPGEHSGHSYRLLDARDGWNYQATAITPDGSSR